MTEENKKTKDEIIRSGISTGAVLAMTMSWSLHHSIVLAILHALCSWVYVILWAVT